MKTQDSVRLHRFNSFVGISTPDTEQLYLTVSDVLALSRELKLFTDAILNDRHPATRIIEDGAATNESDGNRVPIYLP